MDRFEVIIPAAGSGTRMGGNIPKLLLEIGGIPVIRMTVEAFLNDFPECRITVVTGTGSEDQIREALEGLNVRYAPGGAFRAESVYNGLKSIEGLADITPGTKVLVHDGARCLIDKDTILRVLDALDRFDAAVCGVPEKNTFKKIIRSGDDIIVDHTPAREDYYEVQTPQGFRFETMVRCFDPAVIDETVTDDVMLAEKAGITVAVVEGAYSNIKITTAEDLEVAEGLIEARVPDTAKTIVIDGNNFCDEEGFYDEIDRLLTRDLDFKTGHNLNALVDILRGGFGVHEYGDPLKIRWINASKSRKDLGYEETRKHWEKILSRCHPSNIEHVKQMILDASNLQGDTLFDTITELIRDCDGGEFDWELEIEE